MYNSRKSPGHKRWTGDGVYSRCACLFCRSDFSTVLRVPRWHLHNSVGVIIHLGCSALPAALLAWSPQKGLFLKTDGLRIHEAVTMYSCVRSICDSIPSPTDVSS